MIDSKLLAEIEVAERLEVVQKLRDAQEALRWADKEIEALALDEHSDICDVSNDAYSVLVQMLAKLSKDYDINALVEDAVTLYD